MIRSATAASAAVACLLLTGGCRSSAWTSPLAAFKAPASQTESLTADSSDSAAGKDADPVDAKAAGSPAAETVAKADASETAEDNPFRRRPFRHLERMMARNKKPAAEPAEAVASTEDSSTGPWSGRDREPDWTQAPAPSGRPENPFTDPDLQAQIDEELRYTDARDQADLRRTLTGLEPSMARQIIRVRQMARSMGQQEPQQVARTDRLAAAGRPASPGQQPVIDRRLFGHSSNGADAFTATGNAKVAAEPTRRLLAADQQERQFPATAAFSTDPAAPGGPESNEVLRLASGARDSGYDSSGQRYSGRRDYADRPGERPISRSYFAEPSRRDYQPDSRQIASSSRGDERFDTLPDRGYLPDDLNRSLFDMGNNRNDQPMTSGFPGSGRGIAGLGEKSRFDSDLQRLISLAEAEAGQTRIGTTAEERQRYIEKQVYLRMLYLMAGRTNFALEPIHGLDAAHQEFWTQLLWSMANYFDHRNMPNEVDRVTQAVAQLKPAVRALQTEADLEVRNVAFCHRISSFGNYSRFPADEFSPGQKVLVYGEVTNFLSEPTSDGQYRTVLRSQIEILRPGLRGGAVAEPIRFAPTEDLCRNHRQDYFHSYEFTIPRDLPYGPHVMKLTIYDELSRKVATTSVNFTVR
ncbi:MAG: hypothetical protein KDA79_07895 [Planctomycetaceae bacterium]|nr:hypothetical protein [Planctomycetaceae bacterium]